MKRQIMAVGLIITCMGLVLFSGCTTTGSAKKPVQGLTYRVSANSLVLGNRIRVLEKAGEKGADLLKAKVRIQNISEEDMQIEYRFVWIDKNGAVTEMPTSEWKSLSLKVKGEALMEAGATSPDATDYLLSFRDLDK